MAYLEYAEYVLLGGVCDATAFARNIDRASAEIDNATYNRVSAMATVPQLVKACCRDLVEYLSANANTSEKGVSNWSQSAGAVSESVSYETKSADDIKDGARDIIFDYLFSVKDDNGTPLLYKGAIA